MKKKIIFSPIQVGIAHIIRSLAVAEEISYKHEAFIVLDQKKVNLFPIPSRIKKILIDESEFDSKEGLINLFSNTDVGKQKAIFYTNEYIKIFKQYKPDIVVCDQNYHSIFACLILKLPHVCIINSSILPFRKPYTSLGKQKILWKWVFNELNSIIINTWLRSFNSAAMSAFDKYKNIVKPLSIFQKNTRFIIPEVKEYNPLRLTNPNYYFVGHIIHKEIEARDLQWEARIKKRIGKKKVIYITFGGTGFGEKLFLKLIKCFLDLDFFVIASAGTVVNHKKIRIKNENLLLEKFLPGMSANYLADIIVSHGSYGTIMQALLNGKPIVCIPFNFEQFLHATRVQESEIGLSTAKWRLSNYLSVNSKNFQSRVESLDTKIVVNMVMKLLIDPKYKRTANNFMKRMVTRNSANRAAQLIEKVLKEN